MLTVWSHKVGHIDLIHRRHQMHLKKTENLNFPNVSHTPPLEKYVLMHSGQSNKQYMYTYMYTKIGAIYHSRAYIKVSQY